MSSPTRPEPARAHNHATWVLLFYHPCKSKYEGGSTAGLAGGSFPLVAGLYVVECVEPNSRGTFGVLMNVMNVSGALFVNGVGSVVDWVALTGILIIFPGNFDHTFTG